MKLFRQTLLLFTGYLVFIAITSCSPKEQIGISEDPRLQHSFQGYYRTCEKVTIGFGSDGRFACEFSSTEYVGHFCDVVWGTYSVDSTHVYLQVDRLNKDNVKYDTLPVTIADSIVFTPSGDSLRIFFEDGIRKDESILVPRPPMKAFPTAGNRDDDVYVVAAFSLAFISSVVIPSGLIVLLVWLLVRWLERGKKGVDYQVVKVALDEFDFYGLLKDGCPADEFDAESKAVAKRISKKDSVSRIAKVIADVFNKAFDCQLQVRDCIEPAKRIKSLL